MKKIIISIVLFLIVSSGFGQNAGYKCYPTHWWTGMKWNKVQVMVHGDKIADHFPMIKMGPAGIRLVAGVNLVKINRVENPNYVFLDLVIDASAKPGKFSFPFVKNINFQYELKPRRAGNGSSYAMGVTSKDFMYLIMPDRFSNGDESNDRIPGMKDQSLKRDTVYNRHGGDLKGIQNHLDYLQSLGVTTLWLNPVLENDMPDRTEHGYAFTDHYKVDARLGGDKAYQELIDATHAKGMKMIQDAVYNHVGLYHFTVQDQPMKDWLHQWPDYTNTSYKDQTLFDPHGSSMEKKIMTDGWFTKMMPDLNQHNPFVVNFLIEHALWTVEEFGIDGWRIDTYAYNDLEFMNRCNKALEDEYPKITLFGETWVHGVINQSYFVQNNYNTAFKSNLQAPTDFQTLWSITDAMTKDFGWTDGVNKLYTVLAQDFVYKDPMRNVIFLDNHDISRFYSVIGENTVKYKTSINWLLTCRGIPQFYYGGEIGMTGVTNPNDGFVRQDFPGGWTSDPANKFTNAGRTEKEREIWDHIARLANYRKSSSALTKGKMMQFLPLDGVYVYFRYDDKQTIMVIMNTAKEKKNLTMKRFAERTNGFSRVKNILTGAVNELADLSLESYDSVVFELLK
ncbi:MAG TPA: alpha-amylase family glycosyl hydrolase [Ferruginibacter sp.]|nr:alpha-amylase family glycosyl hydrolase [Ferruginibacter sp.]